MKASLRLSILAILPLLAVMTVTGPAAADRRFPAATQIAFDPHDARTAYVRTTFGLVATHDDGNTWGWICEAASGPATPDPSWVVTPKGTLVGNTAEGLQVSRDGGCSFTIVAGPSTQALVDLTTRPDGTILGVTSSADRGAKGAENHIVVSSDDGKTFSVFGGPIDPTLSIKTLRVSPADAARLYLSGVRGEGEKRTAAVMASYDAGMSWVERTFELAAGESAPLLGAVDPKNPDRVYLRTAGDVDTRARLMVTDDGGKTWRKLFEANASGVLGFALAEDGGQVFVGTKDGVSYALTTTLAFAKGSSAEASCLATTPNRLWACSNEKSGFFVGASTNGGRSLDAKLRLEDLKGPLACSPESDVTKKCAPAWPAQRNDLGLPDPDEKVRTRDPGAPTLRGRGGPRTQSTRSTLRGVSAIVLVGMAAYYALKRLRRRR
jgi:photosystem II stability/assembly factor-like uncharacterized protein